MKRIAQKNPAMKLAKIGEDIVAISCGLVSDDAYYLRVKVPYLQQHRAANPYDPRPDSEILSWAKATAMQGDTSAEGSLGIMYWTGKGVPQDYVEAYKWLNLALVQSGQFDQYETDVRNRIAQQMTPEQIAEAQRLSREFQPHKESASGNSK
jgi:hypothetical protein